MTSQLRDLAARIEDVARQHPAYSQAWQVIRNCSDHLSALAWVEEANKKTETNRKIETCECPNWGPDGIACKGLKPRETRCRLWVEQQAPDGGESAKRARWDQNIKDWWDAL